MNPMFDLRGQTALVTGSSRGIGAFIARGLAEAGAHVIVHGRGREGAEETAHRFREDGLGASATAFDVSISTAVSEAVDGLIKAGCAPSILVNNAGINLRHPAETFPEADWHTVLNTNLNAAFYLARAVAGPMLAAGYGRIINVCSIAGSVTRPGISAYSAAKGGLKMLTRSNAVEWGARGINSNGIAPGFFATDMNKPLIDNPEFDSWVRTRTPQARWGRPEDIAGAATFLASPAASYVNGHILVVDGGFLASM